MNSAGALPSAGQWRSAPLSAAARNSSACARHRASDPAGVGGGMRPPTARSTCAHSVCAGCWSRLSPYRSPPARWHERASMGRSERAARSWRAADRGHPGGHGPWRGPVVGRRGPGRTGTIGMAFTSGRSSGATSAAEVRRPPRCARSARSPGASYLVCAPASNHLPISARSASVMPVALFIGMILVTTTCW